MPFPWPIHIFAQLGSKLSVGDDKASSAIVDLVLGKWVNKAVDMFVDTLN